MGKEQKWGKDREGVKMGPTRGGAVRLSHGAATLRLLFD